MTSNDPPDGGSPFEAAAVGVLGAVCAGAVGSPIGFAVPFAVVGGLNGLIAGWRRIYTWDCAKGPVAAVLDSTWALPMTAAGLAAQALGLLRGDPGFDRSLSARANRLVFRRGFVPRRGFAITIGNVIAGAGDTTLPRRRRLVTEHEDVHVWQSRWLGPLYPLVYALWMMGGAVVGVVVWVGWRRHQPFTKVVETCAYYLNPFEWWAYSRADYWPPSGKVEDLGWRHPIVRPLRRR